MHEISVCQSILKTIETEMDNSDLSTVREIHLKVGILSNIDAELLKHVFTFVKLDSLFNDAELYVEVVDILAKCDSCENIFTVKNYKFVCPACDEPVINILEGKELLIHKIILEEPAHEEINQ